MLNTDYYLSLVFFNDNNPIPFHKGDDKDPVTVFSGEDLDEIVIRGEGNRFNIRHTERAVYFGLPLSYFYGETYLTIKPSSKIISIYSPDKTLIKKIFPYAEHIVYHEIRPDDNLKSIEYRLNRKTGGSIKLKIEMKIK